MNRCSLVVLVILPVLLWAQSGPVRPADTKPSSVQEVKTQPPTPDQMLVSAKKAVLIGALDFVTDTGLALNPSAKKAQASLEKEMRKWGRFTVVNSSSEAELVIVLFDGNRAAGGGGTIRTSRLRVFPGGRPLQRGETPLWEAEASGSIFLTSGAPKVIAQFRAYLENLDARIPKITLARLPDAPATVESDQKAITALPAATPAPATTAPTATPTPAVASATPAAPVQRVVLPARPAKYVPPLETIRKAKTFSIRGKGASGEQGTFDKVFAIGKYGDVHSAMGNIYEQMQAWGGMQFVQDTSVADIVIMVYQWDTRTYSRQFHGVRSAIQIEQGGDAYQRRDPALWASGTVQGSTKDLIKNLRFDLDQFERALTLRPTEEENKDYKRGCDELRSAEKKKDWQRSDLLFEAVADLRKSLRSDYGYAPAHERLGTALLSLRFDSAAAYEFELALRLKPYDYDTLVSLSRALTMIPDFNAGERTAREAIAVKPDLFEAHDSLGDIFYKAQNYPAAESEYRETVRLHPSDPDVHAMLGRALYRDKKFADAEIPFKAALKLKPDDQVTMVWLGAALVDQQKTEEALPVLRKATVLNSSDGQGLYQLGRALRAHKDLVSAVETLKKCAAIAPMNSTFQMELGHTLADAGQLDQALAKWQEISANVPNDASVHDELGSLLLQKVRTEEAIKELERAITLDPKLATAYFHLGRARENKGDLEGAKTAYEMARTLDPQNPDFVNATK